MTFTQWLFGGIDNPPTSGQWGPLHIAVMLLCVALILTFHYSAKKSPDPEKFKKKVIYTLVSISTFMEIMLRFMYFVKLYYYHHPEMEGLTALDILLPKPWCQISTWLLISSVFVKKPFYYNLASHSAFLSAVVFFIYPGEGFNNEYLLFVNWYSICTHSLLLVTSVTMTCFKFADFRFKHLWKEMIGFAALFAYGLIQIYVLKVHEDPMYFMPNGDIQAGILRMDYGLYLFSYIVLILTYINVTYLVGDRENVKLFFAKRKSK